MSGAPDTVGVVLAGGRGRRLGGDKALVGVAGRPLVTYPLRALHAVCDEVAIVAKRETVLPPLHRDERAAIWLEPDEPRHPLTGLVEALRRAGTRQVLVCAVDLALVDPATLRTVLAAATPDDVAVVVRAGGRLEPLCGLYRPEALRSLARFDPDARVTEAVEALGPRVVELDDPTPLGNVNAPEDVIYVTELLRRRLAASAEG